MFKIFYLEIHEKVRKLCTNYESPIGFWLAEKFIVFCTKPNEFETVLTAPETPDRGQVASVLENIVGGPALFTSRGDVWKTHRKLLSQTMRYSIINSYYPIFNENMKLLTNRLAEKVDQGPFNIYDYLEVCTLDMITGNYIE